MTPDPTREPSGPRLLLIASACEHTSALEDALSAVCEVTLADSAAAAAQALGADAGIAVIAADDSLPDGPAHDLLARSRISHGYAHRLLITQATDPAAIIAAVNASGADHVCQSPADPGTLTDAVRALLSGGGNRLGPASGGAARIPSYHERFSAILSLLENAGSLSCLFVDMTCLRRLEIEHGAAKHAEVVAVIGAVLSSTRGEHLRRDDLLCRTDDGDGYVCFLAPSRTHDIAPPVDLEGVSARIEAVLENQVSRELYELSRDRLRLAVGYARVLHNPMLRSERLVSRLVADARQSAALQQKQSAQRDKALLQELILHNELYPLYQPIVHLDSAEIFGYESLIRGPRGTTLEAPAALFSVADEVDLTFELDRACFHSCLASADELEPVHRLFVNLLPMSFYDTKFIQSELARLIENASITPANVVFEITEKLAIENFRSFKHALGHLTGAGFGVAIDDVGTRHSNLEAVMALRPHFIKISDVLTRGVSRSTVKREMLRSLGRIAEAIDAVVVAEGLENPDDLAVVRDLGVHYGQGFFLARPAPPFISLRPEIGRAVRALATRKNAPIPPPPLDYDDSGDLAERAHETVKQAVLARARQSGEMETSEADRVLGGANLRTGSDFADEEPTRSRGARIRKHSLTLTPLYLEHDDDDPSADGDGGPADAQAWMPLTASELGKRDDASDTPLMASLRRGREAAGVTEEPTGSGGAA
ncbi:MAG TPA: EAL domain-containing response regulator [Kofleriaceae bacterium]|nr:EAL domain-containing response regulator [Kofleriaceae bacterium]